MDEIGVFPTGSTISLPIDAFRIKSCLAFFTFLSDAALLPLVFHISDSVCISLNAFQINFSLLTFSTLT
ncbi:wsv328 [White spot syndrome virus]|uniref:Wsv328 n=4 Tax=White spot syndrome virus TaxID=342409 RepID=Q8VAR8_WSSVS|nr:wsv328 [Shrimp white spot syndrome virus]AFX59705.1 wsv328 [White spot syndrome virus]AAL33330.1 wsv328 [Shrimp white spot syndrome virus]AAL89252.1 WSSV384 [Shrimp white spot syndrome virus]AWQ60459.1 wsv328 [Shrimp white spot syndrome virus]AWQ60901.1 wsv328 [Shrimp white spot syndrome virus]